MAAPRKKPGPTSTSLAKALKVLTFIGLHGEAELAEIAEHTGYPKSTLLRLINTMIKEGFLQRQVHGRYQVTLKVWRIGAGAVQYARITEQVVPTLRQLVESTGETAHYSVYDTGHAVYIEKIDGLHPVTVYTRVGGRSPAYASATGKALLAWQDESEIKRVAEQAERFTDRTQVGVESILQHAQSVRRAGYAVNRGEWRTEVWGVGAPIFGKAGEVEAAVGISGPTIRIKANLQKHIVAVTDAAIKLSEYYGAHEQGYRRLSPLGSE